MDTGNFQDDFRILKNRKRVDLQGTFSGIFLFACLQPQRDFIKGNKSIDKPAELKNKVATKSILNNTGDINEEHFSFRRSWSDRF